MNGKHIGLGLAAALLAVSGLAQNGPAGPAGAGGLASTLTPPGGGGVGSRVDGTVKSLAGDQMVIATVDGKSVTVKLPADLRIEARQAADISSIHVGDFVGSGAKLGADGKLRAQEVHIFSEARRGMGEGHRAMGNDPSMSMTNAVVVRIERGAAGSTLVLKYPGGEQSIEVASNTPIMKMVAADRSSLKPGAQLTVVGMPDQTGSLAAMAVMLGSMPRPGN